MSYTRQEIANALDFAVLKPTATLEDIQDGCAYANKHRLKSICVASVNVRAAAQYHDNVSAVIGFPHGNAIPFAKFQEAVAAIGDGATELDVVINYGRYLGGDVEIIDRDLSSLCNFARHQKVLVKAILETCYYTPGQIVNACKRCVDAGVDFVKTSTGFGQGGATVPALKTMLAAVAGSGVEVKASGGIQTYADVAQYLDVGCTRLGASRYLELLNE